MTSLPPVSLRWQSGLESLARLRHPLLLGSVLIQTWADRDSVDWPLLTNGARALFGPHPLSLYTTHPLLQAGPTGLAAVRLVDTLPPQWALPAAHFLLAVLGWFLLWLAERWYVPGARFRSVPLRPGLTTLAVGLPVLQIWSYLAGGSPHIEDGLVLLTFLVAARAVGQGRTIPAAILIGLTIAWKPWGVVALPMLMGLPGTRPKWQAIAIGIAVPAACWLPFLLADPATLKQVSHGFELWSNSPLRALGMSGADVPEWWRSAELTGALAAACIAAVRRDWRAAFAAGCTARLLLDPAGFDYYVAGLIMVTALTERIAGLKPWRTSFLACALIYAQLAYAPGAVPVLRLITLTLVLASWMHPWRMPKRLKADARLRIVASLIPLPREPQRLPASSPCRGSRPRRDSRC